MRLVRFILIGFLIFGIGIGCAHQHRALYQPTPISVPDRISQGELERRIEVALTKRGWIVDKKRRGEMQAHIARGTASARINVGYSRDQVKINYVSSQNMNFASTPQGPTIHTRYNTWVKNIEKDLRLAMFG